MSGCVQKYFGGSFIMQKDDIVVAAVGDCINK